MNAKLMKYSRVMDNGCILWTAGKTRQGYGKTTYQYRTLVAHRAAWENIYGRIPNGLLLLHKCDNPACINIDHLFLGTQQDNMNDMRRKGRQNYFSREKHPQAKLTSVDVDLIRDMRRRTGYTYKVIAREFNVSKDHVGAICRGVYWK